LESNVGWGQLRFFALVQFFNREDLQFGIVFIPIFWKELWFVGSFFGIDSDLERFARGI